MRELVTGAVGAVPGAGTFASPWRIDLVGPLALVLWRDDTALRAELVAAAAVPVLGDYTATTSVRLGVATLDPARERFAFADAATVAVRLSRTDGTTARLAIGDLALLADSVGVELVWSGVTGPAARLAAEDLTIEVDAPDTFNRATVSVPVPLPEVTPDGLRFPAPDWDAVEPALAALVARVGLPEVDAVVSLLGWSGSGPRLSLGGAPRAPIPSRPSRPGWPTWSWTASGSATRSARSPGCSAASPGAPRWAAGTDATRSVAPSPGEPRAPGLAVWLDPGCAVPDRGSGSVSTRCWAPSRPSPRRSRRCCAAAPLPDVADLLVGRDSLGTGLSQLADRWTGTDGIVGAPGPSPTTSPRSTCEGKSYDELVAFGLTGGLLTEALDPLPAAVVHVGCEALWVADRPAARAFDLSQPAPATGSGAAAPGVPAAGGGTWTVRLPTPTAAAADRPDRGGVGEQAARLLAVLAGRSEPVTLVGYGAAGAAVVRAAASLATDRPGLAVQVATVGTPWGEVGTIALTGGLSGDALRLLALLTPTAPRDLAARAARARVHAAATVAAVGGALPAAVQQPVSATGLRPAAAGDRCRGAAGHRGLRRPAAR